MEQEKEAKILIVSDSHGNTRYIRYAIGQEAPFDMLIFCGDACVDLEDTLGKGRDYDLVVVRGNLDTSGKKEVEFERWGRHFLVTHGDKYGVKFNNDKILQRAREVGADTVLCGHSHVPEKKWYPDGILLVNPGSIAIPHQDPPERTYAVMTIQEGKKPEVVKKVLPDSVF